MGPDSECDRRPWQPEWIGATVTVTATHRLHRDALPSPTRRKPPAAPRPGRRRLAAVTRDSDSLGHGGSGRSESCRLEPGPGSDPDSDADKIPGPACSGPEAPSGDRDNPVTAAAVRACGLGLHRRGHSYPGAQPRRRAGGWAPAPRLYPESATVRRGTRCPISIGNAGRAPPVCCLSVPSLVPPPDLRARRTTRKPSRNSSTRPRAPSPPASRAAPPASAWTAARSRPSGRRATPRRPPHSAGRGAACPTGLCRARPERGRFRGGLSGLPIAQGPPAGRRRRGCLNGPPFWPWAGERGSKTRLFMKGVAPSGCAREGGRSRKGAGAHESRRSGAR